MSTARDQAAQDLWEWDALFLQSAQTASDFAELEEMPLRQAARWVVGAATWPKGGG